ncbi:MAG: signal peptide peptidase SppA [Thermodesulfobacteriota bacterium]|nr:signal peptide peptidase SppA [Thermodesulfobacteriota bacterium]
MKRKPVFIGLIVVAILLVIFFVSIFTLTSTTKGNFSFVTDKKIAVVNIEGTIKDSRTIIDHLLMFKKDEQIKAIVLRIDSPGGGIGPTQEIYEEIKKIRYKDKKRILASMGSVAASGGYYIACAAEKIVANPGTITGSIGVIIQFANVEELMRKIGFKSVLIKSGEFKDVMSPFKAMTNEERNILQGVIDSVHNQFIEAVVNGRKLKREDVIKIADGRIFSGEQAKELGLVDSLGTLQDTISMAAEYTGITGEPKVVYPPQKGFSLFDFLFRHLSNHFIDLINNETHRFNYQFMPNR